jgi:hypothetical protein
MSHGVGHLSPPVLPEAGRALDVDEQKCDRTRWYAEPSSDPVGHHSVVPGQGAKQAADTVSSLVHEPSLRPDGPRNLVRVSYFRAVGVVQTIYVRAMIRARNVSAFACGPAALRGFATLSRLLYDPWLTVRDLLGTMNRQRVDRSPQLNTGVRFHGLWGVGSSLTGSDTSIGEPTPGAS